MRDANDTVTGIIATVIDVTEQVTVRQKTEAAKAEVERQKRLYETITSNTPDLIYVFDLNYRFTYVNKALLEMWGKTWEHAVGNNLLQNSYERLHLSLVQLPLLTDVDEAADIPKEWLIELKMLGVNN